MANEQAMCKNFILNVLNAMHAFGATEARGGTTKDTFKGALYYTSATINALTTVYTVTGEITASGSYTAGGINFTNNTPPDSTNPGATSGSGNKAWWTPSASWTTGPGFTAADFNCILMYNDTFTTKRTVAVFTFGSTSIVAGTFTLTMPTNDGTTGLIRFGTT